MHNKVLGKVIASILVVLLTAGNLMLIGSSMISYAGENLEAQEEKTTHENVEFGAYFESEGKKVHSLIRDAKAEEKLYLHLNVKKAGFLKNGQIEILGANYTIKGKLDSSEIIGARKENKFELKQIGYGTEAVIEVPIGLEVGENYFVENISKDSKIILRGTYVTAEGKEVAIDKTVTLNMTWKDTTKIEASSQIKTYQTYKTETEEGTILQEVVTVEKTEGKLPVRKTTLQVKAPELMGKAPVTVRVNSIKTEMTNGNTDRNVQLNWNYNKQTGMITIETENKETNGRVWSKVGGKDEYIITYEYAEDVTNTEVAVERKANVVVEGYTSEKVETKEVKTNETLTQKIGNIVYGQVEIAEAINKAKIYANYNSNRREYETEYRTKEKIHVTKASAIEGIIVEENGENFLNNNAEEKSSRVNGIDYTYYQSTKIAVENFNEILGTQGSITITNEAGKEIGKITAQTKVEDGSYVVSYPEKAGKIAITTSKPVVEGILFIEHEKAIKADLAYTRAEVEAFSQMNATIEVGNSSKTEKAEAKGIMNLTEAVSNLKLESNKNSINKKEENIELKVEFGNKQENSILYKNPTVRIALPKFVEDVKIDNTNLLFDNELQIAKTEVTTNENQEKVIEVELAGTQTRFSTVANANGSTLIVGANIVNKEEAGEGNIVAEVGGNTATTEITSNLKATQEETNEPVAPGEVENPGEQTGAEEKQDPRIKLTMSSPMENLKVREEETITYIIKVNNISDYLISSQGLEETTLSNTHVERSEETEKESESGEEESGEVVEPEGIKNIVVKDFIPSGVTYEKASLKTYRMETGTYEEVSDGVSYDAKNRVVTWNIGDMLYEPEAQLLLTVRTNFLSEGVYEKEISNSVTATYDGSKEISSNRIATTVGKAQINVIKLSENIGTTNKVGDKIKLIVKAENVGKIDEEFQMNVTIPEELEPIQMTYGKETETVIMSQTERKIKLEAVQLEPEESYLFELEVSVKEKEKNESGSIKTVTPYATVNEQELKWNIQIDYANQGGDNPDVPVNPDNPDVPVNPDNPDVPVNPDNPDVPVNPDNPDVPVNPDNPDVPVNPDNPTLHVISGTAWLDTNRNGVKEEGEERLKQIKVNLIEPMDNHVVQTTTTDNNGNYQFEKVEQGEYQIVFEYDNRLYKVTEYRKTGQLEVNSSAIETEEGKALTDIIKVVNKDIQYMNIGLVKIPEFDMSLTKQVSRIIVQNQEGTKTYEYNNDFAKADINAKYLSGTTVLVEYKITIKNEGELAGRVKKIVDYMPRDMIFSTDVNKTWVQGSDGNLYNSELKDINIEPGETKEITLILRKKMTEDNTGIINNTAELVEVENSENMKDKDSTPANKMQGEDDMSSANVLLGVKTGAEVVYTTLAVVIMILLATGIYLINRKVLKGMR